MTTKFGQLRLSQPAPPAPHFTQLLPATPRGARLARLLTVEQLVQWGWLRDGVGAGNAALVVAEFAANAVTHGRLPGRCFRLGLGLRSARSLRIEVTDPRGERLPALLAGDGESGRGLALVNAVAADWGVRPYLPSGKTVWADVVRPT